ncbi:MAG: cytochrome b/b6 domain-containing protein [Sneathiella sp.]
MTDNPQTSEPQSHGDQVKVWDIAVRVFHWSLVCTFALAWISADEWDQFHEITGYIIGGLIIFRLLWGFIGSKYARFRSFVPTPSTAVTYVQESLQFRARRYLGHNPAGGAMIVMLLGSLVTVIATGIAMTSTMFWGSEWIEDVHEVAASLTVFLIVLHVAGVIFSSLQHRENLVRSMITGWKRRA